LWDRFFKTSDLGFYNSDGTIEFVGRKDTQVKIRGQRVELEEVETKIRTLSRPETVKQVVVDVLRTEARTSLVAYLCFSWDTKRASINGQDNMTDLFLPMTEEAERMLCSLKRELESKLPSYMVPTVYIPLKYMQYSTKLDRKTQRQKTAALDRESLARYSLMKTDKQPPRSTLEIQMQQL
jgi:acyl-CoA synthetase (AMP-forming)/AMP-acid ligase II